jgi:hypothetical protein
MRPRFSIKWLLIAVTLLSVALFVLVIYPTNKAKRYVAEINADGIDLAKEISDPEAGRQVFTPGSDAPRAKTVSAELLPWTRGDLLKMRRRVQVVETITAADWDWFEGAADYQTTAQISVSPAGRRLVEAKILLNPRSSRSSLKSVFSRPSDRPDETAIDVTQER